MEVTGRAKIKYLIKEKLRTLKTLKEWVV